MAGSDAEAAFLSSMQDANDAEGNYEPTGADLELHADSSAEEEYDPSQALQDGFPNLQSTYPSIPFSSTDALVAESKQSTSASANTLVTSPSLPDTFTLRQSTPSLLATMNPSSRSVSRTSAQSNNQSNTSMPQTNGGSVRVDTEAGEQATKSSANGVMQVGGDNMGPVQRSVSHTPINQLSTNVSIPNAAQDQGASGVIQNGVADTVPKSATVISATGVAAHESMTTQTTQTLPPSQVNVPHASATEEIITPVSAAPRARLPHDRIGILEDRIKDDPRGDMDAWLSLINEHKRRSKLDDARQVYDRYFAVFPSAVSRSSSRQCKSSPQANSLQAEQWIAYAQMENDAQNRLPMEHIFNKTLLQIPNVQLWALYLGHVRRHNNLTTDTSGAARQIISQAYDLALQHIGIDKDSGGIWQDYVQFIRSGPGIIGGSNWQDQQKMDLLRKTYQRAICIPTQAVHTLWKEYDGFEMGLNKMTVRFNMSFCCHPLANGSIGSKIPPGSVTRLHVST